MSAAVQPAVAGIAFTIDGALVRLARRYPGEWLLDPGPVALAEVTVAQWPVQDARLGAGLVQDLYLTTSPKPGGEPDTPLYPRPLQTRTIVRKHGTGLDLGVTFAHLALTGVP
jgi:hypothetical protein